MPAFDYKCEAGHITEHFLSKFAQKVSCSVCEGEADYYPSFFYNSPTNAQRFSPIVIHKDALGNVRFPAHADAPVPIGFEKVKLTDFHQVRKFERDMEQQQGATAAAWRETRGKYLDGQLKANREAVNAIAAGGAWEGLDERGNIITRHGLSEKGKRFLDCMREQSQNRQHQGPKGISPAFFVEALTQNASNREEYHDAQSRFSRGRK